MADDYSDSSAASPASANPQGSEDDSPPINDAPESPGAATPQSSTDQQIKDQELQGWKTTNAYLEDMLKRSRSTADAGKALQPEIDALKASIKQTDQMAGQQPTEQPPPQQLNQQQKGDVATAATSLLKIAAVAGLAYGMRGRGAFHNSMFKLALGSFLGAYGESNKKAQDASQRLWEKNWQMYKEHNKEVNQRFNDMLKDNRLSLDQKYKLIEAEAKQIGEQRLQAAASNKNLQEMTAAIHSQQKFQLDADKEVRKHADKLNQTLGKGDLRNKYLQQYGVDPSDPAAIEKAEKDHPYWKFLEEEHQRQNQENLKQEEEKLKLKKKYSTETSQEKHDISHPQETITPDATPTDEETKKMHDALFGEQKDDGAGSD